MDETSLLCTSCWVNQARICKHEWNNPANASRTSTKITAQRTATKSASGSPLGAIKVWKVRMLMITGASTATAGGTYRLASKRYACDDLKRQDHPQVVRGVQGTHELSRDASGRGKRNEVQEAIQAENKKDYARQIAGDCESSFHNQVLLLDRQPVTVSIILMSI
jgi:hypothetical protein